MRQGLYALLFALALAGAGCRRPAANEMDARVVALVNGEVISRQDFELELSRESGAADAVKPASPEQLEPVKRALLDSLIERTLISQAAKQAGISASQEEVDRRLLRMSADFPAEGFEEALANGKLSVPELKQKTAALITAEKLFSQAVYARIAVTEEDLRKHYEAHRAEYSTPEQVRAAQIVVKTLDEARRVQRELRSGRKFDELARRYSLSADAKVGGDLGFFERGVMPPAFDQVAFSLNVGEVSDVVETDYGFHLFKLLDRKGPRRRELAEARSDIEATLLKAERSKAQAAFVKGLRDKADVRINEPLLQTLTWKG